MHWLDQEDRCDANLPCSLLLFTLSHPAVPAGGFVAAMRATIGLDPCTERFTGAYKTGRKQHGKSCSAR
jgi:hypothetical protein